MYETNPPGSLSDHLRPDGDHRLRVPDTSLLPGSEQAAPPAINLLNQAVRGAHDGIDRLAETVTPAVRKLGETVSAAEAALHAKTDQLRETGDEWVDNMRTTVRRNPLACLAVAVALGAVVARISR